MSRVRQTSARSLGALVALATCGLLAACSNETTDEVMTVQGTVSSKLVLDNAKAVAVLHDGTRIMAPLDASRDFTVQVPVGTSFRLLIVNQLATGGQATVAQVGVPSSDGVATTPWIGANKAQVVNLGVLKVGAPVAAGSNVGGAAAAAGGATGGGAGSEGPAAAGSAIGGGGAAGSAGGATGGGSSGSGGSSGGDDDEKPGVGSASGGGAGSDDEGDDDDDKGGGGSRHDDDKPCKSGGKGDLDADDDDSDKGGVGDKKKVDHGDDEKCDVCTAGAPVTVKPSKPLGADCHDKSGTKKKAAYDDQKPCAKKASPPPVSKPEPQGGKCQVSAQCSSACSCVASSCASKTGY